MAGTKRYVMDNRLGHGRWDVRLSSWKWFHDFIRQQMLIYTNFVWRGHRCEDWALESALDRELRGRSPSAQQRATVEHLENFQYAVRGRRGPNPPRLEVENDWWALGQHNGLLTPLLDWSSSPFVALYFAFAHDKTPQTDSRVVYALSRITVTTRSNELEKTHSGPGRPPVVEFVRPFSDENARLVNQGGLFTRSPARVSIENWMVQHIEREYRRGALIKITIPNTSREECLRALNRMNINHLTLFPDLYGASTFCNTRLKITKY